MTSTPLFALARQHVASQRFVVSHALGHSHARAHTHTHAHTRTHTRTHAAYHSSTAFVGPFARCRDVLDYEWHTHYPPARQVLQDDIISACLPPGHACARPWLVHTAGPMGSGKSYTMRNLHRRGLFPLDRFLVVDPDKIKRALPEMDGYVKEQRHMAGTLTHKESGYIAEIIEREAMLHSRNVLVDGSLRNVDWYARCFGRIRTEFPEYRIAILLVTASRERIFARAARRAVVTGREVPRLVLEETIEQVPRSFNTLAPLADFTAVLHNDDDASDPIFQAPDTEAAFKQVWSDVWDDSPIPRPLDEGER